MRAARRQLSTVTVAASTALITALVVAGGPALAATVVDFAKNAGAVDGKKAVSANASVVQRKGKLVATGALSGQLPNNIIAKAPDSARLGGTRLSDLATHYLTAFDSWLPATTQSTFCKTAAFKPTVRSVALIQVSVDARAASAATYWGAQAAISSDGGSTFARTAPQWWTFATSPAAGYAAVSASASVPLAAGRQYTFAGIGYAHVAMSNGDCSLTVQIVPALPGTSVVVPPMVPLHVPAGRHAAAGNR